MIGYYGKGVHSRVKNQAAGVMVGKGLESALRTVSLKNLKEISLGKGFFSIVIVDAIVIPEEVIHEEIILDHGDGMLF
jgi:hypothetical protein